MQMFLLCFATLFGPYSAFKCPGGVLYWKFKLTEIKNTIIRLVANILLFAFFPEVLYVSHASISRKVSLACRGDKKCFPLCNTLLWGILFRLLAVCNFMRTWQYHLAQTWRTRVWPSLRSLTIQQASRRCRLFYLLNWVTQPLLICAK